MYTLRDVCRRDSGESYTCARPTGQRGLRTPAFGADTVTGREEPVRHVVRGPFGFLGPRPARPAVYCMYGTGLSVNKVKCKVHVSYTPSPIKEPDRTADAMADACATRRDRTIPT